MSKTKIRRLSEVTVKGVDEKAHLSTNKRLPDDFETENHELLYRWRNLWDNLRDFRSRYARATRYHRGDQWGDLVYNPDKKEWVREEDYIREQGKVPLKQNIIRQLMKNLQGQYRRNPTRTNVYPRDREDAALGEMMTIAIQNVHDLNHMEQLDAQLFVEAATSGLAVQKSMYKFKAQWDREDIYIKNVNQDRIFFDNLIEDVRMDDIRTIGEIHDMPLEDVVTTFGRTEADENKIKYWYSAEYFRDYVSASPALSQEYNKVIDFFVPHSPNVCRVIEGWYKKAEWRTWVHDFYDGRYYVTDQSLKDVEDLNRQRIQEYTEAGVPPEEIPLRQAERRYDQFWYVKHLTPYGHTLHEGETPYDHGEHPYEMIAYPFVKGEVWGLVEDIIDQQRYVNRLITQADFIRGASAKGLLLVHEDSIPDGMNIDDFSSEWSRVGGVIKYKGKAGTPPPQQVASNSIPGGLQEMLTMQLKLTYDIMGIHQAIQGQKASSGTPASLYAQEAENASMNVKDFFDTFSYLKQKRDRKVLMLIRQFYEDQRMMHVVGQSYEPDARVYDPDKARDVNFELKVTQGPDTPVYRQVIEDVLTNLLSGQLIDLEMYLEHSSMPFADKLLQSVRKRREQDPGVPDEAFTEEMQQAQGQMPEAQDPRVQKIMEGIHAQG